MEGSTDGGSTFDTLATVGINAESVELNDLIPGTAYQFRVYATNTVDSPFFEIAEFESAIDDVVHDLLCGELTNSDPLRG